ncbi:MAG: Rrf2 family transcriptional regulator [Thermodesulfobacteriota bacterium]|nr:Rrf2 family transcriptional regulator [Thermodesulfobacteriota bacterium]
MRLTTKSRYGTRLLLDLAAHSGEKPVPLSDIAKRQSISLKYLEKLISKLRKDGLIASRRGPFGGYMLARPAEEITISDIVRSLEGTTALTECSESDEPYCGVCNRAGECLSRWVWIEASNAMFERLDQITLASLINGDFR